MSLWDFAIRTFFHIFETLFPVLEDIVKKDARLQVL